jgi:hypothetical protein
MLRLSPTERIKSTRTVLLFTVQIFKFENLEGFYCLLRAQHSYLQIADYPNKIFAIANLAFSVPSFQLPAAALFTPVVAKILFGRQSCLYCRQQS